MRRAIERILLATVILTSACDRDGHARRSPREEAPPPSEASEQASSSPPEALPARSLHRFDAAFTDQDGRPFRLAALRGHPTLVLMFYGTCKTACPLLIDDLLRIDRSLSESARAKARFLLVSFDPENDTTERLRTLALTKGMDLRRFTLVTGRRSDLLSLSVLLDVRVARRGPGDFSHSNVITLLDADGVIAGRLEGLHSPVESTVADVERLSRGDSRPPRDVAPGEGIIPSERPP